MKALKIHNQDWIGLKLKIWAFTLMLCLALGANAQKSNAVSESVDESLNRPTAEEINNALSGIEEIKRKEAASLKIKQNDFVLLTESPTAPPTNDMFSNAQVISGSFGLTSGSNVDATLEAGEPSGSSANKTVWYRWTAPSNLSMTFEISDGSLTDTVLGVYTGNTVNALNNIAWNDDINGVFHRHSRVTFIANAGTVYYIQVRGFGGFEGNFTLMREINGAETYKQFNFDGDDGSIASDFGVFRPSNNYWYLWLSGSSQFKAMQWGALNDRLVPQDYDGDGGTDIAVWRPSVGTFYVFQSMTNTFKAFQWGINGDTPLLGDFDGDDHADFAVWRAGNFYVYQSSDNTFVAQRWGLNGDYPACGDYDGDGKTDFGVQRAASSNSPAYFYVLRSSNGSMMASQFGVGNDVITPGDYDGDGKNDIAVYRYSTNSLYYLRSIDGGFYGIKWGSPGDYVVTGDYIGGYRSDVCVWRPSVGTFYCLGDGGTGSFYGFQFGMNGDYPVGNSSVH